MIKNEIAKRQIGKEEKQRYKKDPEEKVDCEKEHEEIDKRRIMKTISEKV